jgi:ubiquinone/menaquinone biosynthesis C-methylase UbiE
MTLPRLRSDPAAEHEHVQRARGLLLLDQGRIRAWERLLFVECGDGWIVEEAWRRARRGYACGVDRSAALVARANALRAVPGALEFKTWDGSRLPYPSGLFQHVMSTVTMDRGADPMVALGEMHRVLQPGGDVELLSLPELAAPLLVMLGRAGFHDAEEVARCDIDGSGERAAATLVHARAPLTRCSLA